VHVAHCNFVSHEELTNQLDQILQSCSVQHAQLHTAALSCNNIVRKNCMTKSQM